MRGVVSASPLEVIRFIALSASLLCLLGSCQPDEAAPPPAAPAPAKTAPAPQPVLDPAAVAETLPPEEVVKEFGRRMKDVPTTAAVDIAAAAIRRAYGSLVEQSLLDSWTASPAKAPGRAVSSPWPDRIEVTSSSRTPDETLVTGVVVEVTSTGEARRIPVELRLRQIDGAWVITSFAEVVQHTDADYAVAVIHDYYAAIGEGEFERAYGMWGSNGPPEQTLEEFEAGFADTVSVEVETGEPARVEGAAGSHYVRVPVTITAKTRNGATETFEGSYTVRRTVVDGAPESDRRWHLHRATIDRISRAIS